MMSKSLDPFMQTKLEVDLAEYMTEHAGVELSAEGRLEVACCPFHQEDTPSFKLQEGSQGYKVWRCYGGCEGSDLDRGSIIDYVMREQGFDEPIDAVRYLDELYDLGIQFGDGTDYRERRQRIDQARDDIKRAQDAYSADDKLAQAAHAYLSGRGYDEETIKHFSLGVSTERRLNPERTMTIRSGRITIPFYDHAGSPVAIGDRAIVDGTNCRNCGEWIKASEVGYAARKERGQKKRGEPVTHDHTACPHCSAKGEASGIAFLREQDPKYWFPRSFDKSNYLYNEQGALQALKQDKSALGMFLCEGQADVWAVWAAGQKSVVSYNGKRLSPEQASRVAKVWSERAQNGVAKPIILIPDFDKAGLPMVRENIRLLKEREPNIEIRIVSSLGESKDGKTYKDAGEVLQYEGAQDLATALKDNVVSSAEWSIREIVNTPHPHYPDQRFHSRERQQELVAMEISSMKHAIELDHLVPWLSKEWKTSPEQVGLFIRTYINSEVEMGGKHLMKDIDQARKEAEEYLKDKHVIPHGFDEIDSCLPGGGAKLQQLAMFLGKSGTGKAQPLDAKILTPQGWITMGDVRVGTQVINPSGGTANVIGIFPQGVREIYKVTFSDGSSTECDKEHLWEVLNSNRKRQVRTLGNIIDNVDLTRSSFQIPLVEPVAFQHRDLPIDPYLFGMLLGDGSFCGRSIMFTTTEEELLNELENRLPQGMHITRQGSKYDYRLVGSGPRKKGSSELINVVKELGLRGAKSSEKFIPDEYKYNSTESRLALLRGLMDTDGSVSEQTSSLTGNRQYSVNTEFCTVSERLARDVQELVQSLGGTARIVKSTSTYTQKGIRAAGQDRYRLAISMPPTINPFKLKRKAQKWGRKLQPSRRMLTVEYVGNKEAQCILLDSENHLYVTDDYIVTHNTMLTTQVLTNMVRANVPAIFFSLEQPPSQLYMRMVCQALDVNLDEAAELVETGSERLEELRELYKDLIIIDNVPNSDGIVEPMTPGRVQKITQEVNMLKLSRPAQVVAIDHLGIMQPPEYAPASVKKDDMQAAGYIMQELFSVAKIMNVYMMVLQQLPKEVPPGEEFGYDAGRGSSKQTDYCDYIFCIWRPEMQVKLDDAERRALSGQYKLAIKKNRHGSSGTGHLWFDKRNLRILPALQVGIGYADVEETEAAEGESGFGASLDGPPVLIPIPEPGQPPQVQAIDESEQPTEAEESEEAKPLPLPTMEELPEDAQDIIDALSQGGEDEIDPDLLNWWES
jgi:DNA primase/replicative DNA helicase